MCEDSRNLCQLIVSVNTGADPCACLSGVCRSGSGCMTYRELRRSDLLDALFALEREEDINRVSRYFR